MAGFETPKYEPPKSLAPNAINKQSYDDVATQNFLENERKIRGHIKGPWKLTPAEENEQVLGNELWNLYGMNPLIGPPADHPLKELQLDPLHNLTPDRPTYLPLRDRKERLEW